MRVVLSPHLDDAVLSAFTALGPGTTVVNVFDGIPDGDAPLTLWDRLCGATSSREQALAREAEDEAALAALGVERRSLGFLDAMNAAELPPEDSADRTPYEIRVAIDEHAAGAHVLVPLAGGPKPHPDHRLVRDAALVLLERRRIASLTLYADVPYCVKAGGWPAAWGGQWPDPPWLGRALREARYVGAWWTATWRELDEDERARKLAAMRGYRTQFDNLDRKLRVKGLVSNPAIYGAEVFWRLERPPRPTVPLS